MNQWYVVWIRLLNWMWNSSICWIKEAQQYNSLTGKELCLQIGNTSAKIIFLRRDKKRYWKKVKNTNGDDASNFKQSDFHKIISYEHTIWFHKNTSNNELCGIRAIEIEFRTLTEQVERENAKTILIIIEFDRTECTKESSKLISLRFRFQRYNNTYLLFFYLSLMQCSMEVCCANRFVETETHLELVSKLLKQTISNQIHFRFVWLVRLSSFITSAFFSYCVRHFLCKFSIVDIIWPNLPHQQLKLGIIFETLNQKTK